MIGPVYFLHIEKTAGTSVHRFLTDGGGGPDRVTGQLFWDDITRGVSPVTAKTEIIVGHFTGLLPLWLRRWPIILTMLRDPIARSLSHINHMQRDVDYPLHERAVGLDVVEYCADPVLRRTISDYQARHLASLSFARALFRPTPEESVRWGTSVAFEQALSSLDPTDGLAETALSMLDTIDAVGVTERFDCSLALFSRTLGWEPRPPGLPLNPAHPSQRTVADLRPDELEVLRDLTRIDQMVYDTALARLDALCEPQQPDEPIPPLRRGIRWPRLGKVGSMSSSILRRGTRS